MDLVKITDIRAVYIYCPLVAISGIVRPCRSRGNRAQEGVVAREETVPGLAQRKALCIGDEPIPMTLNKRARNKGAVARVVPCSVREIELLIEMCFGNGAR